MSWILNGLAGLGGLTVLFIMVNLVIGYRDYRKKAIKTIHGSPQPFTVIIGTGSSPVDGATFKSLLAQKCSNCDKTGCGMHPSRLDEVMECKHPVDHRHKDEKGDVICDACKLNLTVTGNL